MRFAVDMGGTFTDLVLDDGEHFHLFKSPTTPEAPLEGIMATLDLAAGSRGTTRPELLRQGTHFIHATTRALNAALTGTTGKTAFLTTAGHPDILLFREGGRREPFNHTRPYPPPYVPRALTFQVPERIGWDGAVVEPLDESAVAEIAGRLRKARVEAVAVCLLWSIANPEHEERVGAILAEQLPDVPVTLSHRLNPSIREYRRASSACIDASLKPVMSTYLGDLSRELQSEGFGGRLLMVTSAGGVLDADAVAAEPIHALGSGPAVAPVAGRAYARIDADAENVIVADTGGTSYDVSLVRNGRIPSTREHWLGEEQVGHITGFPAVDVKSIGAGGGSIAWVDDGGLLHVGPQSAGSSPGPACYGRGGTQPTVTDAAVVLGFIDPGYFLGGSMPLDASAAEESIERAVATPLGLELQEAAAAVIQVATEHMIRAIEEVTLYQGIDPRTAVLVGGGGAAGLNSVAIGRRLGCAKVIVPEVGAALSAAGALLCELSADFAAALPASTSDFDFEAVNGVLAGLRERCARFAEGSGADNARVELSAEARYPHQVWELELPLRGERLDSPTDVDQLRADFHALHREVFAIADPESAVEIVGWRARVRCRLAPPTPKLLAAEAQPHALPDSRTIHFPGFGERSARIVAFDAIGPEETVEGPAIVESPVTTVVIDPGATASRTAGGSLVVDLASEAPTTQVLTAAAAV